MQHTDKNREMTYVGCMVYQGWHVMKVDGLTKGELIQSHREDG